MFVTMGVSLLIYGGPPPFVLFAPTNFELGEHRDIRNRGGLVGLRYVPSTLGFTVSAQPHSRIVIFGI
jgi:hypothetical protein